MIYVMECGPILQGALETWVVFSLDLSTSGVTCHIASRRDDARKATAAELSGATVSCCASLSTFGRPFGWRVKPTPERVRDLACVMMVGIEHQTALGPLAFSPLTEAWLRACAGFLDTAPWRRLTAHDGIDAHFEGRNPGSRVLVVTGSGRLPPGLVMLPDRAAFERAQTAGLHELEDAIILTLGREASATSTALQRNYGFGFHPLLLRLEKGKFGRLSQEDFKLLIAAICAMTSYGTGRPFGHATVEDVEATVMPWGPTPSATLN